MFRWCGSITETYNIVINFLTYNFSKEKYMLPEVDLRIDNFLTYNFSKEKYMLPEVDLRIETCRSVLNVLV